jgi:hypothetical protein
MRVGGNLGISFEARDDHSIKVKNGRATEVRLIVWREHYRHGFSLSTQVRLPDY